MYLPSDDSYLLAEAISLYKGISALEIGVGSGIIYGMLLDNFQTVVGSDIDLLALKYCKNRFSDRGLLVCCDAASAFTPGFDLIVTNPPYLPEDKNVKDNTVYGGPRGIETTLHFIDSALSLVGKKGKILTIVSSLADLSILDAWLKQKKLQKTTIKTKRLFFETLSVIEIKSR